MKKERDKQDKIAEDIKMEEALNIILVHKLKKITKILALLKKNSRKK